jgi:hypothetical protein
MTAEKAKIIHALYNEAMLAMQRGQSDVAYTYRMDAWRLLLDQLTDAETIRMCQILDKEKAPVVAGA